MTSPSEHDSAVDNTDPSSWVETFLWVCIYLLSLGFAQKYRERLYYYEDLDPGYAAKDYEPYSEPPSFLGAAYRRIIPTFQLEQPYDQSYNTTNPPTPHLRPSSQIQVPSLFFEQVPCGESIRSKQGEEWDKLSTAASVITATSAAALAIPGLAGTDAYWLVNCSFCAALGVSLEGLLLVQYLSVMAGGASDETLGRLARGKLKLFKIKVNPIIPAIIMSLPMSFATYSALYLLAGTMVMVLKGRHGPVESPSQLQVPRANDYLPMIPVIFGLFCLLMAVLVCEAGTYYEIRTRQRNEKEWRQRRIAGRGLLNMTLAGAAAMGPALHPAQVQSLHRHVTVGLQRVPHTYHNGGQEARQPSETNTQA